MSVSSVTRALRELVIAGLVEKAARYRHDNGCTSNLYTLHAKATPEASGDALEACDAGILEESSVQEDAVQEDTASCQADTLPLQADTAPRVTVTPQELVKDITTKIDTTYTYARAKKTKNVDNSASAEEKELQAILDRCELSYFKPHPRDIGGVDYSLIFHQAIIQMYYAESVRVGGVNIPRRYIRQALRHLNFFVAENARNKLEDIEKLRSRYRPCDRVHNTSAYVRTLLYNCIAEVHSELVLAS